jgi:hypothetical protein
MYFNIVHSPTNSITKLHNDIEIMRGSGLKSYNFKLYFDGYIRGLRFQEGPEVFPKGRTMPDGRGVLENRK